MIAGRHGLSALALLLVACAAEPELELELESAREAPPPPQESEEALPAILAPPQLLPPRVTRSDGRANVELSWTAVTDATAYRLEVAKLLTFTRLVEEARVATTHHRLTGLKPAVYFWRVCVESTGGEACTPKTVMNALPVVARANRAPGAAIARPSAKAEPVAAPPAPEDLVPSPEPVGDTEAMVAPEAQSAGAAAARERRLKPVRKRYQKLQAELQDIRTLRRDLAQTIRDLERTIETRGAEADVTALREELKRIEKSRAELDREIAVALAELDRITKGE